MIWIAEIRRLMLGFKSLAQDERIPSQDKAVLLGLLALLVSPIDIIPDFIPLLGQLDDVIVVLILLDYTFRVLPHPLVLEHFPYPSALARMRRITSWLSPIIPEWVTKRIFKLAKNGKN